MTWRGRLLGIAASREAAITLARRALGFRAAAIENLRTGEVWQGAGDDWRQTLAAAPVLKGS